MGPGPTPNRGQVLTVYLLDTTVLVAYLRGTDDVAPTLLRLLGEGHTLATSCVNVAEVERGLRPRERRQGEPLTGRLQFLVTDREAARRAGRYQADWASRGRTIRTAYALIAGTARAHGAVLLTHNLADFPMPHIRVQAAAPGMGSEVNVDLERRQGKPQGRDLRALGRLAAMPASRSLRCRR